MQYFNVKNFIIFLVLFLSFLTSSCTSTDIIRKTTLSLETKEFNGIKHYKDGNYEEAFNLLKEPAAWGYKGSQYTIAFMFLKGQYLQQSTLLGMGWLGVAKEANVKEWSKQYDVFYSAATKKQKLDFDKIKEVYIKRYGLMAQDVTCRKSTSAKSRRVRVDCYHYDGVGVLYDIDLVE